MCKKVFPYKVRSNGVRCDNKSVMLSDPKCPCFSSSEVGGVVSDLIAGKVTALFEKLSCGENIQELYGLHYAYDTLPSEDLSLLVSATDMTAPGACMKDDTEQSISTEEEGICLKLLQGECETLEDKYVDLGRCPCFNEDKLDVAVKSIQDGSKVLVEGSCTSNSSGDTIDFFYEDPSCSLPWPTVEGYSIYVSSIIDS